MKTMILTRHPGTCIMEEPEMWLVPDSAIVLPGRPLFLPDFSQEWTAHISPALRVSRLGKGISSKFASRYYDALTLIVRLQPEDMVSEMKLSGGPQCLAAAFDNCLQLGKWIELTETGLPDKLEITANGATLAINAEELKADMAVSVISRYMTIRNGDIICPAQAPLSTPVSVGTTITASINGEECLSLRIK